LPIWPSGNPTEIPDAESVAFAGPALAMSAVSPSYDFFSYYITLAITPMMILCGVFYPVDSLPEAMQHAVQALPLTHAIALVRPLTTGGDVALALVHLAVLAAYAAAGFYVAVALVRRRRRGPATILGTFQRKQGKEGAGSSWFHGRIVWHG